jgi:16S rRNA (cytosine1402-N4)-methyltransferase
MERHQPVMVREVRRFLPAGPDDWICDATVGSGGHGAALLEALGPEGRLIGLDEDPRAIERARRALEPYGDRVVLVQADFRDLGVVAARVAPRGLDGVLIDLGVSSEQLDDPAAGFSYREDGPLLMTRDPDRRPNAADLLNTLPEAELSRLLKELGDVQGARRIARAIVTERPLSTTTELVRAVRRGGGGRPSDLSRVFQAIRMATGRELEALAEALGSLAAVLKPGGRVVVISYHSGEDRLVKQFFRPVTVGKPLPWEGAVRPAMWELFTRRALRPMPDEVARNARSRSARLRAARRVF